MPRGRSLATKWALRYGGAAILAISLLGAYLYGRIEGALRRDALLILEAEVAELLGELGQHSDESPFELARMIEPEVASAEPDLRISFQIFDEAGRVRYGSGILHERNVPVPPEVAGSPGESLFRELDLGSDHPYWALASNAGEDGSVQVAIHSRIFARNARRIRDAFLTTIPIAFAVAGGLGLFLARGSLRPVSEIVAAARRITGENLQEDIPTSGCGDEFDQIAEAFNGVLARIRAGVESLQRFTADAAHQLRTPLTALRSRLEVSLDAGDLPREGEVLLEGVLRDVARMADTVEAMLQLNRSERGLDAVQRKEVPLDSLLQAVVEFFEPIAEARGISLSFRSTPEIAVIGDASWLRQLFGNLVENAIHFTPKGGWVAVRARRLRAGVDVEVEDSGRGIPREEIERIFERFHRVDADAEVPGVGLGLTIARNIAAAHGGSIDVVSAPGEGSTFRVGLPLG